MGLKISTHKHKPTISKSQIPWLLRGAIRSNNVETLQYLLSYPNHVDPSMVIDGVCPLNLAIELGHFQLAKILVKAGADIYVNDAPRYPLHQAALYGRPDIAEFLIKSGASVNALNFSKKSCLHMLASQTKISHQETLNILLHNGADPNQLDEDGLAPLHFASVEMIPVFLNYTATNLNILNKNGETPLIVMVKDRKESNIIALLTFSEKQYNNFITCQPGSNSIAKEEKNNSVSKSISIENIKLNQARISLLKCNEAGWNYVLRIEKDTGLSSSSLSYKNAIALTEFSLSMKSQMNFIASVKFNSLDRNSRWNYLSRLNKCVSSNFECSKRMKSQKWRKSNEEILSKSSLNVFKDAFNISNYPYEKCATSISNLINSFQQLNSTSKVGNIRLPPISSQFNNMNYQNITNLLDKNQFGLIHSEICFKNEVNIDQCDKLGMTSLMISAEAGNTSLSIFKILLSFGASLLKVDKMSMTALHYACYVGALSIVCYTFEHIQSIMSAEENLAIESRMIVIPTLCYRRSSTIGLSTASSSDDSIYTDLLNSQDKYGRTPIYLATARGHTNVVNYLLSLGADLHTTNKENKSPLYISAYFGYVDIVNSLLRFGANVNQADSHQKTPLYVATYHGRFDVVELLLTAGANVNAADKSGRTALYIAVLHGHLVLANKLLAAGASANQLDHEGLGPLHMAVKFPKLDIPMIKLLLKHDCDPVNLAGFTRFLVSHGVITEEYIRSDLELSLWLRKEESNVKYLKQLCRQEIQLILGNGDPSSSCIKCKVARLPIPEHLRSYLFVKEL